MSGSGPVDGAAAGADLNAQLDWAQLQPLLEPDACSPAECGVNCCYLGVYIPELGANFASEYHCKYLDVATQRCTIYERRLEYPYCFALLDLLKAGDCTRACTCARKVDLAALGYRGKERPPAYLADLVRYALFTAWRDAGGPPENVDPKGVSDYLEWHGTAP